MHVNLFVVQCRIFYRILHTLLIDIDGNNLCRTEMLGKDRQYTGSGTVIEYDFVLQIRLHQTIDHH